MQISNRKTIQINHKPFPKQTNPRHQAPAHELNLPVLCLLQRHKIKSSLSLTENCYKFPW